MKNEATHSNILRIKAKEDLDAAKKLASNEGFSEEIVLYHCQQALEKALKAFLDSKSLTYPKTHDLEILLSQCVGIDPSFEAIQSITAFTPYAVEIRYDELLEISRSEVQDLLAKTDKAVAFILNKI